MVDDKTKQKLNYWPGIYWWLFQKEIHRHKHGTNLVTYDVHLKQYESIHFGLKYEREWYWQTREWPEGKIRPVESKFMKSNSLKCQWTWCGSPTYDEALIGYQLNIQRQILRRKSVNLIQIVPMLGTIHRQAPTTHWRCRIESFKRIH